MFKGQRWPRCGRVLIDVWEENVISTPSVQTWIPPVMDGQPIIEGLFDQLVCGRRGAFQGTRPLRLPDTIEQKVIDASFLLAVLFQRLGYVGRCSFDLILVGPSIDAGRIEFVECNARWGGTSIPMTLMNRLQIAPGKTYGTRLVTVPGLNHLQFRTVLDRLEPDLFDARIGSGTCILTNPARITVQSAIEVIAIGNSPRDVEQLLSRDIPLRLQAIVDSTNIQNCGIGDR